MNVLRLHGAHDVQLHQEPMPVPKTDEQLLRVTAVGVCGSDLHWFAESGIGDARLSRPLVLGHEFAGVVDSGPHRGQRVAVDPAIPCEQCEFCLEGHPNLCANIHFAGHGSDDGALREYMAWPERNFYPIPDTFTDADGVMLEPLGVAIHAVDLGHLRPGMTVGVFGCGPIGLLIVQLARAAGATRVFGTDVLPHRLEAARSFGAGGAGRGRPGGQGHHGRHPQAGRRRGVRSCGRQRGGRNGHGCRQAGRHGRAGRHPVRRQHQPSPHRSPGAKG